MASTGSPDLSFFPFCLFRMKIARGLNVLSPAAGIRNPDRELKLMRTCETCNQQVSSQDVYMHRGLCQFVRSPQRFMCQTCCSNNLSRFWTTAEEMELGIALASFLDLMDLVFKDKRDEYHNGYVYANLDEPVPKSNKRKLEDRDQEAGPSKKMCLPENEVAPQNVPDEVHTVPQVVEEPLQEVMEVEAQDVVPNEENARPFARRKIIKTRGIHPRPRDEFGRFVKCETRLR